MWDSLNALKTRIIELVWAPAATTGMKLAALKVIQRVILVQTRGVTDPRVSETSSSNTEVYHSHTYSSAAKT